MGLLLSPLILQHFGWRALFYLFGLAGAPLLAMWALVVPGRKQEAGGTAAGSGSGSAGAAAAAGTPGSSKVGVLRLLSKPATWAIIIANFGEQHLPAYG